MDSTKLDASFEIDSTVSWIKQHGFRRVALQFPDSLLSFAIAVTSRLEKGCDGDAEICILADTTYRSCCVDQLGAEKCGADCIVHYGDSCISEVSYRLPILFVYGNVPVDLEKLERAVEQYKDEFEERWCLLYDAVYADSAGDLFSSLNKFISTESLFHSKIMSSRTADPEPNGPSTSAVKCCLGRQVPGENRDMTVVFVGEPSSPLLPLWMMSNLNCTSVFIYSPTTSQSSFEKSSAIRYLRKRLYLIERLRDAQTVGLVLNTVDVGGYKEALERARELCRNAGKKSYTFTLAKITIGKLSNFANDVEVFIVLSCPYGVILDVSNYYRPVISLFEAEVALNPKNDWAAAGGWTAEFQSLLHDEIGKNTEADADMSLVTGKIRSSGVVEFDDDSVNSCNAVTSYTAGDYFGGRTWKGLDGNVANESVAVQEGRSGIASQYKSEPSS